ncbi:MAG: hypothetical protein PHH54_03160 [Candidatus Nanoarchaeia archaeon]|nr:hypothetical protein [Candidatus Nanoarchaeia archaeon]MDD5740959.1 hypothetical protein [Candidatus Nanoarchaeia archaeon]
MTIKRTIALLFAFVGITLAVFSLTIFQSITGNVIGANSASKFIGVLGILFMIIAIVIEKYELKRK